MSVWGSSSHSLCESLSPKWMASAFARASSLTWFRTWSFQTGFHWWSVSTHQPGIIPTLPNPWFTATSYLVGRGITQEILFESIQRRPFEGSHALISMLYAAFLKVCSWMSIRILGHLKKLSTSSIDSSCGDEVLLLPRIVTALFLVACLIKDIHSRHAPRVEILGYMMPLNYTVLTSILNIRVLMTTTLAFTLVPFPDGAWRTLRVHR